MQAQAQAQAQAQVMSFVALCLQRSMPAALLHHKMPMGILQNAHNRVSITSWLQHQSQQNLLIAYTPLHLLMVNGFQEALAQNGP